MLPNLTLVLGANDAGTELLALLPWLGLVFVLILVGGVVVLMVRNRLRAGQETPPEDTGFTLADLRKLRDRGELSAEEYELARVKMIAKVKGTSKKLAIEPKPEKKDSREPEAESGGDGG